MNVYESVMQMSKEEFSQFCFELYNKGWVDGAHGYDDEGWVKFHMADIELDDCRNQFDKVWGAYGNG